MRRITALAIASLVTAAKPATARAGDDPTGIEVGARLGFALPLGGAGEGEDLNRVISNMVPIWLDAGYRFTQNLYGGAFFMYGFGSIGGDADICHAFRGTRPAVGLPVYAGCSIHDMRLGANAHYHFIWPGPLEPWAGVGFGFEWLEASASVNSTSNTSSGFGASGFEFFNLQAGLDFKAIANLGIGPFFALTVAQYDNKSHREAQDVAYYTGVQTNSPISDKSPHAWLIFGVRCAYDIHLF